MHVTDGSATAHGDSRDKARSELQIGTERARTCIQQALDLRTMLLTSIRKSSGPDKAIWCIVLRTATQSLTRARSQSELHRALDLFKAKVADHRRSRSPGPSRGGSVPSRVYVCRMSSLFKSIRSVQRSKLFPKLNSTMFRSLRWMPNHGKSRAESE